MKLFRIAFLLVFAALAGFSSCSSDDDATPITVTNFSATIDSSISDDMVIGTVQASGGSGSFTYTISNQSIAGAFAINATTGVITIANEDPIYDARCPVLTTVIYTATVTVTDGSATTTATVTISLVDVRC